MYSDKINDDKIATRRGDEKVMTEKVDLANIMLRHEQPVDNREAENLTREAFWNFYEPGCNEHYLLHIMRDSPAFVSELDFVAICDGRIVGNAVYAKSFIKTDDGNECEMLGLGPISVLPEYQSMGIGGRLIEHTKQIARDMGCRAILLYGDPLYYSRHGFIAAERFDIRTSDNMYAEPLQVCELYENALSGITGCYFEDKVYEIDEAAAVEFDRTFPPKEKVEGTASQTRFSELVGSRKPGPFNRAIILEEYNPN